MNKICLILLSAAVLTVSACTAYSLNVAEAAYEQGDYPMAISHAKIARKASSDNSPEELRSLYILARSYEAIGNVQSAKYVYNMIVQSYPDTPEGDYARTYNSKH